MGISMSEIQKNKEKIGKICWFILCVIYILVLLYLMPYVLEHFIGKEYYTNSLFILSLAAFIFSKYLSIKKENGKREYLAIFFLDLLSLGGIQIGVATMIPIITCKVIFTLIIGGLFFYLTLTEYFRNIEK